MKMLWSAAPGVLEMFHPSSIQKLINGLTDLEDTDEASLTEFEDIIT
jgi:hypothetical protein